MKKSALIMLLLTGCLVGCGGGTNASSPDNSSSPVSSSVDDSYLLQGYQGIGKNYELSGFGFAWDGLVDFNSAKKGTLHLVTSTNQTADGKATKSNKDISFNYSISNDEDKAISIKFEGMDTITSYLDDNNEFTFTYTVTFGGSYTRPLAISVSKPTKVQTIDDFMASIEGLADKEEEKPAEKTATYGFQMQSLTGEKKEGTTDDYSSEGRLCTASFYSDKSVVLEYGMGSEGAISYSMKKAEGTYAENGDGTLTVTIDGSTISVSKAGTYYMFDWVFETETYTITAKFAGAKVQ